MLCLAYTKRDHILCFPISSSFYHCEPLSNLWPVCTLTQTYGSNIIVAIWAYSHTPESTDFCFSDTRKKTNFVFCVYVHFCSGVSDLIAFFSANNQKKLQGHNKPGKKTETSINYSKFPLISYQSRKFPAPSLFPLTTPHTQKNRIWWKICHLWFTVIHANPCHGISLRGENIRETTDSGMFVVYSFRGREDCCD